jgi:hypothetical protein
MKKKILPVAVATLTLVLGAGGTFAEPPKPVAEGAVPSVSNHEPAQLTDADLLSVTGRGACTEDVQALGRFVVVIGLIGMSHLIVATGQVTIGLGPFVCA